MKKLTALVSAFFLAFTLSLALPMDSDAARLGGGRSFGSQPSMRAPARAPAVQQSRPQQGQTAQAANAAQQPRRGFLGGLGGGILGGLLAGTLIGSLLSGAGFAGGGLLDIILLAVIIGGVFYFIRRRRAPQPAAQAAAGGQYGQSYGAGQNDMQGGMRFNSSSASDAWGQLSGSSAQAQPAGPAIPPGFDVEDFLRGAKMAYTRMQESWDKRDLNDIANFATDAVLAELRQQMAEDPNPGQTQIVLLNATLLSVEEFGAQDRAQVYFDVLLREDPNQAQPANAREIWHFVRPHETGNWKLDGIQQVEGC